MSNVEKGAVHSFGYLSEGGPESCLGALRELDALILGGVTPDAVADLARELQKG